MKRFQSLFNFAARATPRRVVAPRQFPTTGFPLFDSSETVEEEGMPRYSKNSYYPVRMGEVLHDRYQVVAKLGYGVTSTVWLCRDLTKKKKYWALKVYTNLETHDHELEIFEVLRRAFAHSNHPGRHNVGKLEESFTVDGPKGQHEVSVLDPLGMSIRNYQSLQESKTLPTLIAKISVQHTLLGLDFLHEVADIVHTDLHSGNLLISTKGDGVFSSLEEDEMSSPSARKVTEDGREIIVSSNALDGLGPLKICDFGQAHLGEPHTTPAMPTPYRAPEVILKMPWGKAVDRWSLGLVTWDMLEPKSLFDVYDKDDQELNDALHLAAMTVVLGPPPEEFLIRSEETKKYWDDEGQWIGPVPLPDEPDLQERITRFKDDEMRTFASFVGDLMMWTPERRLSIEDAFCHPWLAEIKQPRRKS